MDDIDDDDKDEEEDDQDMRDPTHEPDELDEEMSSPTSSSTTTASFGPTMTMRHRRLFPCSLLCLPRLVYCLTTEQDALFSSVIYIISDLPMWLCRA